MKVYLDLLQHILDNGVEKTDRTGTGTYSIFGYQMRFDLQKGFPLLTTKKLHLKSIIHELLWFLKGDTNIKYLNDNGVKIWNEWADENGNLGKVYGHQWRSWECTDGTTVDQISRLIEDLRKSPDSRRLIVSAWNVADLPYMALAPCHCLFQFNTRPISYEQRKLMAIDKGLKTFLGEDTVADIIGACDEMGIPKFYLDCQLFQRSADVFLGVPFNIASYALLTMMIANVVNMVPGDFVHTFGDIHIYKNHVDQVKEQLARKPFDLPTMNINNQVKNIFGYSYEDFQLVGYECHPSIKAPVAV